MAEDGSNGAQESGASYDPNQLSILGGVDLLPQLDLADGSTDILGGDPAPSILGGLFNPGSEGLTGNRLGPSVYDPAAVPDRGDVQLFGGSADSGFDPRLYAASDDSQPSIPGGALNPRPWTLADSTIHGLLSPEEIATIDFDGTAPPETPPWLKDSDTASDGQNPPPQPDGGGFYTGLTPWQPDTSSDDQGRNVAGQQPTQQTSPNDAGSVTDNSKPPSTPGGGAAQVAEYILPGLGKTYLDPQFADKVGTLIGKTQDQNIPLQFISGYRDPAQQAALKNDPTAITPADQSLHSAGLSVDVNWSALSPDDQAKLLSAATEAGLSSGGNFHKPDRVHFYSDPGTDRGQLIDNFSRGVAALQGQIPDN